MTKSIPRPMRSAATTLVAELSEPTVSLAKPKVRMSPQSRGTKA